MKIFQIFEFALTSDIDVFVLYLCIIFRGQKSQESKISLFYSNISSYLQTIKKLKPSKFYNNFSDIIVETLFEEKQDILQLLIDQRNALLTRIADDKLKQETALAEHQWRNKYGALEGNEFFGFFLLRDYSSFPL